MNKALLNKSIYQQKLKPLTLIMLTAFYCTSTYAADIEAKTDAENTDQNERRTAIEVIEVNAQKRVQNLQEVPISVTAISGDDMAESAIKDLYDLQANVPALAAFQNQSATNSSFSIRGVGTSSQNFGLESSVGLYVDGVYRARQNSMINNLVDIESVQVLRGPQGTLFGKNTPSGAIIINTIKPSHDAEDSFVELTIGNYGLVNYSGAGSFSAIDDVLAFRVTAFGSQRDGTIDDINFGDNIMNDRNRWGARVQALYTPSDAVSVRIIADYSKIDEICCGAPVVLSNAQAVGIDGKFGSDAFLSTPPFNATVFNGEDFYDRKVAYSFLPVSQMEDSGLSAEIEWDLSDEYVLTSVSGYRAFDSYDYIDTDFNEVSLFGTINDATQNSFSQELRLTYTSDDLNYIVGGYYFTQDLDLDYQLATQSLFTPFYLAKFNGAFDALFDGINAISQATGGAVAPVADPTPSNTGFDHYANQEHESWAVFGQFDYKLSDAMTLTAGLRYTDETKKLNTIYEENLASGASFPEFFSGIGDPTVPETIVPGTLIYGAGVAGAVLQGIATGQIDMSTPQGQAALQAFVPFQTEGWGFQPLGATTASRANINDEIGDDRLTGTLKLSYQFEDNTMIYASYNSGYKSGGTNTDRIANGLNPIFAAETTDAIEFGIKKDFPEQKVRVNAAGYYTEVKDFQANTWTGNGFSLQNAGDYKISGGELEVTWLATDQLEVNVGYARVNAEYDSFERGNCWNAYTWHTGVADPGQESTDIANPNPYCNRSGDRPGGEPQDTLMVNLVHDVELSEDMYSYFQIDFNYVGNMVLDGSNDPYAYQDSYTLINARFFMNIEEYDLDVIIWGRNVLDEEYINRTSFNTPIQDGKMNAYLADPATFGVTLKKRF